MVTRWDPFGEALTLRDAMSRLFEQAVLQPSDETSGQRGSGFAAPLDVHESPDAYTIKVSLPGVKPDDVNIQYQQGMLTVSGEARAEEQAEKGTYHIRERRSGRFSRSLRLPDMVSADKAEATFDHGVLTLRMPKAEETKPRRIAIQTGSAEPAQVGASTNGHQTPATASA